MLFTFDENMKDIPLHQVPAERMKICEACEYYNKIIMSCSQCKCIMPLKTKLRSSICPIGKWGKV
jgi:hypothetical protein